MKYNFETFSQLPAAEQLRLFVEWLGNKSAEERFHYGSITDCALAQFGKTMFEIPEGYRVTAGGFSLSAWGEGLPEIKAVKMNGTQAQKLSECKTFGEAYETLLPLVEAK